MINKVLSIIICLSCITAYASAITPKDLVKHVGEEGYKKLAKEVIVLVFPKIRELNEKNRRSDSYLKGFDKVNELLKKSGSEQVLFDGMTRYGKHSTFRFSSPSASGCFEMLNSGHGERKYQQSKFFGKKEDFSKKADLRCFVIVGKRVKNKSKKSIDASQVKKDDVLEVRLYIDEHYRPYGKSLIISNKARSKNDFRVKSVKINPNESMSSGLFNFPIQLPNFTKTTYNWKKNQPIYVPQNITVTEQLNRYNNKFVLCNSGLQVEYKDYIDKKVKVSWCKNDPWPTTIDTDGYFAIIKHNSSREEIRSASMAAGRHDERVMAEARSETSYEYGTFSIANKDVKTLYNKFRKATPKNNSPWAGSYWPYGHNGIALSEDGGFSPIGIYDDFFGLDNKGYFWEIKNHSCDHLTGEMQQGCKNWWGHCNAWAAAAIKENKPERNYVIAHGYADKNKSYEFEVQHQAGLITELWMSSSSMFVGDTHKGVDTYSKTYGGRSKLNKWIFDKTRPMAQKPTRSGNSAYSAFWDINPKQFFLIFTNYVGINGTGIVIDRFTGDQVWNQPIVGYKIDTIKKSDVVYDSHKNKSRVLFRMKMYWAEDGVATDTISPAFTLDQDETKNDVSDNKYGKLLKFYNGPHNYYSGRLLKFYLDFKGKVSLDRKGNIKKMGRMIGNGTWYHFNKKLSKLINFNDTHPDFIWLPLELTNGGNKNPYVTKEAVDYIAAKAKSAPNNMPITYEIKVKSMLLKQSFPIISSVVKQLKGQKLPPEYVDFLNEYILDEIKSFLIRRDVNLIKNGAEVKFNLHTNSASITFNYVDRRIESNSKRNIKSSLKKINLKVKKITKL